MTNQPTGCLGISGHTAAEAAPAGGGPVAIHVETDPLVYAPARETWWELSVSSVSALDSTPRAYRMDADHKVTQCALITPTAREDQP